jgi:hypothetical protein
MKNLFKIAVTILIFSLYGGVSANCWSDQQCYAETLYIVKGECYTNYYLEGNFYKLKVPCYRSDFIKLEYQVRAWLIKENTYNYNLVFLNQLLIKKGLSPLYY